jgi:hypothetical protein
MTISPTDITIRIVSVLLAIVLTIWLPFYWIFIVALILGQGHFILAYVYQIEGKHLGWKKFLVLVAIFALVCWFGLHTSYVLFTAVIGVAFMIHFCMDEIRLLSGKHTLFTTLEALPLILIYGGIILDIFFNAHLFWYALALSIPVLLVYVFLSLRYHRTPNAVSALFLGYLLVTLLLYGLAQGLSSWSLFQWFIGIAFVHYFIWYAIYWFKLRHEPARRTTYVMRVALIIGLLGVGVVAWSLGPVSILALLFSPIMFDVWVTMHGASTVRFREYVAAFRLSS